MTQIRRTAVKTNQQQVESTASSRDEARFSDFHLLVEIDDCEMRQAACGIEIDSFSVGASNPGILKWKLGGGGIGNQREQAMKDIDAPARAGRSGPCSPRGDVPRSAVIPLARLMARATRRPDPMQRVRCFRRRRFRKGGRGYIWRKKL
jgi:hypothetical protein